MRATEGSIRSTLMASADATPGIGWETSELVQTGMPNLHGPQGAIDPNGNAVDPGIWSNRFE